MTLPSSDEALRQLMIGNRRYVAMRQLHPRQNQLQRQALLEGQHPFAVILSCSDSRAPSELVFDQGLGDLFIVRTAGHVISDVVIGSIEYAVQVLQVPLIMVMGHAQCGAVASTIKGGELPGRIGALTATIGPIVESVRDHEGDLLVNAIKANARQTARDLVAQSIIMADAVAAGQLKVASSYFDLESSVVELLAEDV
jgi:carbonic anhydrase